MTATNSVEPAKDGTGAPFNLTVAAESVSTNKAQKTYLGEPVGETIIIPAQDGTDGTGITAPTGAVGIRGWLSGIFNKLNTSIGVTGTFWQTTQPVSAASLPLPSGAATSALQTNVQGTAGSPSTQILTVQGAAGGTPQPISAASLPLPLGAATAAGVSAINTTLGSPMQTTGGSVTANAGMNLNTSALALETGGNLASIKTNTAVTAAGTSATSGLPVQGMTGGVPMPISGNVTVSGTATVSGTVTANAGTNLNTSLLALESGNLATIGAAQGVSGTGIAQPTGGSGALGWLSGIYSKVSGAIAVTGTFWQTTQPISAASLPLPAGAAQDGTDGTGIAQPTGGVGIRGWLSGIYKGQASLLTAVTSSIPAGSALIGSVNVTSTRTPASETSTAGATAIAASIPAVAGQYSYLSGFFVSGLGATAGSTILCNITNILSSNSSGNTWDFDITIPAGVTVPINGGNGPLTFLFSTPLQSMAINTAIQINIPSFGAGNTRATVAAWGFNSASATLSI